MAEIAFHNVTKRYKDVLAVDNASFTVADNEFFCFFGPPLSGKSTILRLILGLEKPDSGEILIDGKVVNAVTPAARNIAMVFQNLALFPHMSAADNIRFPLVERREPATRIEARLKDAAEKLHIAHILHKMPWAEAEAKVKATGLDQADEPFWLAVRGNIHILDEVQIWWKVIHAPLTPPAGDAAFLAEAVALLPPEPWSQDTWSVWTKALKERTAPASASPRTARACSASASVR